MGKCPKLRLSFLNSIQICRPNDPSTLIKPSLTYLPSQNSISLPTFPTPQTSPHHPKSYPRITSQDKEQSYLDEDNTCNPSMEEPLNKSEKSVKLQRRPRTRRFKRYGSKDWTEGGASKLEDGAAGVVVSGKAAVVEGEVGRSFVVVKRSVDPYKDFKKSMLEMIVERGVFEPKDLEQLLMSFLSLNSRVHHKAILKAFSEIWREVYSPH